MNELKDFLVWNDGTEQYEKALLEKVSEYERVIIFGAGIGGKITAEILKQADMDDKILAYSDNNKEKIGMLWEGIKVIPPDKIKDNTYRCLIIISSTAYNEIALQLEKQGIRCEDLYYFQPAGMSLKSSEDVNFIKDNYEKFAKVYDMLVDEKSKVIFRNLLNYRISKDVAYLKEMENYISPEEEQYFDMDILKKYSMSGAFVDAGAYTGDTMIKFFEKFPEWNDRYICLEAAESAFKQLCNQCEKYSDKNILALKYAVWDSEGEVQFDTDSFGNGEGCRVSDTGDVVKCNSLDNLIYENKIGFIKMDIEGAEHKALIGAEKIIKRDMPILLICIYHKPEDFFDIPITIESLLPEEYVYYIRQYRYGNSETVLYAVPRI